MEIEEKDNLIRLFSFGGGVQSTAVMILQAHGKLELPYDAFVFANVGNDSESPSTIEYMKRFSIPYAEKHGIKIIEAQKTTHKTPETLLEFMYRTPKSVPIPVRLSGGAPVGRSCTATFKIDVISKWIKQNGYTHSITGLGISTDEIHRMKSEQWSNHYGKQKLGYWRKFNFPLIDLRMNRMDCLKIVKESGLPQPPKSACWFCPFTSHSEWIEMKKTNVTLFNSAVDLEAHLSKKSGKELYIRPQRNGVMSKLDKSIGNQTSFFDVIDDDCDSGFCFT